jgi:hypothetical protein
VARLYRHGLKTLSSWVIDRNIFLEQATELRGRFDDHRGVPTAEAIRLIKVSLFFQIMFVIPLMKLIRFACMLGDKCFIGGALYYLLP